MQRTIYGWNCKIVGNYATIDLFMKHVRSFGQFWSSNCQSKYVNPRGTIKNSAFSSLWNIKESTPMNWRPWQRRLNRNGNFYESHWTLNPTNPIPLTTTSGTTNCIPKLSKRWSQHLIFDRVVIADRLVTKDVHVLTVLLYVLVGKQTAPTLW